MKYRPCCEGGNLEVIQAAICSAQFQSQDDFPWLTALTDSITALDADHTIPIDQQIDLQQAQQAQESKFQSEELKVNQKM